MMLLSGKAHRQAVKLNFSVKRLNTIKIYYSLKKPALDTKLKVLGLNLIQEYVPLSNEKFMMAVGRVWRPWIYNREGDTAFSSFWDFYLFKLIYFYTLRTSWWFKTKERIGFCHQLLLKLSRIRGWEK